MPFELERTFTSPPVEGLMLVEVEFDSIPDCDKFVPMDWFGEEVTDHPQYRSREIWLNVYNHKMEGGQNDEARGFSADSRD